MLPLPIFHPVFVLFRGLINRLIGVFIDALKVNIIYLRFRDPTLFQRICDHIGNNIINYCHDRHAKQHSRKAPQTAKYQNCKHNPERGKPGGISEDLRSDNISVYLL